MRIAALLFCLLASPAFAASLFVANVDGITLTLTNEPCSIKKVANLPLRIIWKMGDKTYSGCYAVFVETETIGSFFDDGTVAVIPASLFKPVRGM